jgi:hypothetical protein
MVAEVAKKPALGRYRVNEIVDYKLPVSEEVVRIRRITWGERLAVDNDASAGTRDGAVRDLRRFRQILVNYATKSSPESDDGMTEKEFYSLDPTDGFSLVEEVSRINTIDHPAFLSPSEPALQRTDTSESS